VDWLDPASESFTAYRPPAGSAAESIIATLGIFPETSSLYVDKSGVVWIGDGKGLATFDPATRLWSTHSLADHPEYTVFALYEDADGFILVGVSHNIALYLRRRGGFGPTLITLRGTPDVLYTDRSGVLWAGIPTIGLARLPGRHGEDQEYFRPIAGDPTSLSSDFPLFLHEDTRGRFWVGTADGLDLMDRQTGLFKRFPFGVAGSDRLIHMVAQAVAESPEGDLWVGTDHGLVHLNPDTGDFRQYFSSDGLAHDRINALAFDRWGDLWVGTEGGLSRLNPTTGAIRTFRVEQGLPNNDVLALGTAPNGEVYAETYGNLISIRPADITNTDADPQIDIAGLTVVDDHDSGKNGTRPVPKETRSVSAALTLTHHDVMVNFDLAVLDYRDPERNRYAYMLEGLDRDWVYARGAQRRATYTTLPAGRYRFFYRGADSTGRWSSIHAVDVRVLPAPWRTSWAYALYVMAAALGIAAAIMLRTRAVTARARELEATVQQRTRELSEQRDTIRLQSERLEEVANTKDRLYANVSHEFRTPLTVILGVLERLLRRDHAPERLTQLNTIRRNAQRLLRLVEQLMGLARLDAAAAANPSPQPVGETVRLLVESFRTLAEDRGIDLTSRCDDAAWVSCDADALEKIVVNLLANAVKYTEAGGRITVVAERKQEGYVELSVEDTGIGIPKDQQAGLFTRFYRATDAAEIAPGSGLGLALVKGLVTANHGEIELVSEERAGTTVRVRLPAAAPSSEPRKRARNASAAALEAAVLEAPPASSAAFGSDTPSASSAPMSRALIVEDNLDLCRHLEQVLGSDFRCDFANDGKAGLELAIDIVPDVIICDVMLPKLNGFEVVRQLKQDERTCHIPMVLLTARADEESRLSGLGTLADDYLTKPFSEAELRQRVDRLLAIREILRRRYGRQLQSDDGTARVLPELGARDRRFLERVEKVLDQRFADPELSLGEFANLVAMSERQLQRKLKAVMDTTPREYLRDYRLKKALPMVEDGEPVSAVAFAVGFASQSYFTSCFKARFGLTPSEVRARAERERSKPATRAKDS
jgi:signal transduction histidine kinase/DNA-binding response OmpR family regulator